MTRMSRYLVLLPLFWLPACASKPQPRDLEFVELKQAIPGIIVELPYATGKNFFKHRFYQTDRCFLRRAVAERLAAVQRELNAAGLGLKVWDGYRPRSVQYEFWKVLPDEKYVADPKKGSRHNRGAAVDVTLVDLKSGKELAMPTGFDDFTPKAAADYADLPPEKIRNRKLLRDVMTKNGFEVLPSEWWHFDVRGWKKYALEDFDPAGLR